MRIMTPYYLYRKGKLKKVEREEPKEDDFKAYPLPICFDKYQEQSALWKRKMAIDDDIAAWQEYINSLTSIEVHPDLKLLWHEGQHLQEGKDFIIGSDPNWEVSYPTAIPIPVEEESQRAIWFEAIDLYKKMMYDREGQLHTNKVLSEKYRITRIKE